MNRQLILRRDSEFVFRWVYDYRVDGRSRLTSWQFGSSTNLYECEESARNRFQLGPDVETVIFWPIETREATNYRERTPTFYWQASWCCYPAEQQYKGCPLGRADTEQAAIRDLLYRTNMESNTLFTYERTVVVDRRPYTQAYRDKVVRENTVPRPTTTS